LKYLVGYLVVRAHVGLPVGSSDGDDVGEGDGTLVWGDVGDSVGVILGKEVGEVDR